VPFGKLVKNPDQRLVKIHLAGVLPAERVGGLNKAFIGLIDPACLASAFTHYCHQTIPLCHSRQMAIFFTSGNPGEVREKQGGGLFRDGGFAEGVVKISMLPI
jgi:hypothetical protein